MILEMELPSNEPYSWSKEIYYPRKIKHIDKKIWKIGEGNYDEKTKRKYISQIVFIENDKETRSFEHKFCLQLYEREVILNLLTECNFLIKNEYCNHDFSKDNGSGNLIIEGINK